MKKLSLYIFLCLMWCNVGFAKPVLLGCKEQNPSDSNEEWFTYFSLDIDKKIFELVAGTTVAKNCALGNCEELRKFNHKLPLIYDESSYLSFGQEDSNQYTINKKDLSMTWASYYWSEIGSTNTFKQVNTITYHSCKKINKFPF